MKRFVEDNGLAATGDCPVPPAAESGPATPHSAPGGGGTGSDGEEEEEEEGSGAEGFEGGDEDPDYLMVRRSSQLPSLPTMDSSFSVK